MSQSFSDAKFEEVTTGSLVEYPCSPKIEDFDFRGWLAEQGKCTMTGPQVRAAGRIVLQRDTGKLRFVNITDWTGGPSPIRSAASGRLRWKISKQQKPARPNLSRTTKSGSARRVRRKLRNASQKVQPPRMAGMK